MLFLNLYLSIAAPISTKTKLLANACTNEPGIPTKLAALKEEDLDFLAESAYADACAPGNPKAASVEDMKALIRKLM